MLDCERKYYWFLKLINVIIGKFINQLSFLITVFFFVCLYLTFRREEAANIPL